MAAVCDPVGPTAALRRSMYQLGATTERPMVRPMSSHHHPEAVVFPISSTLRGLPTRGRLAGRGPEVSFAPAEPPISEAPSDDSPEEEQGGSRDMGQV